MKKLLIIQPQVPLTVEQMSNFREDIMTCFENNKPIILCSDVNYEVVEVSDSPVIINYENKSWFIHK